jgi:hypothetical protein
MFKADALLISNGRYGQTKKIKLLKACGYDREVHDLFLPIRVVRVIPFS